MGPSGRDRDEVVDQRLRGGGVLGCPFDETEDVLLSVAVDADGADQHDVLSHMQAIDLDDEEIELGQIAVEPSVHTLL